MLLPDIIMETDPPQEEDIFVKLDRLEERVHQLELMEKKWLEMKQIEPFWSNDDDMQEQ